MSSKFVPSSVAYYYSEQNAAKSVAFIGGVSGKKVQSTQKNDDGQEQQKKTQYLRRQFELINAPEKNFYETTENFHRSRHDPMVFGASDIVFAEHDICIFAAGAFENQCQDEGVTATNILKSSAFEYTLFIVENSAETRKLFAELRCRPHSFCAMIKECNCFVYCPWLRSKCFSPDAGFLPQYATEEYMVANFDQLFNVITLDQWQVLLRTFITSPHLI